MWTCPKCGELIEDQFDSCWKCAASDQNTWREAAVGATQGKPCSNRKRVLLAFGFTLGIGVMCFVLSMSDLATGREGTAPYLFPYAYWGGRVCVNDTNFNFLLLGQFPVYAIAVAWSWVKGRPVKGIVLIAVLHILFALSLDYLMNVERQYRVHF